MSRLISTSSCAGRGRGAGGRGEDADAAEETRKAAQISHAELVARAQKDSGPISIGGSH